MGGGRRRSQAGGVEALLLSRQEVKGAQNTAARENRLAQIGVPTAGDQFATLRHTGIRGQVRYHDREPDLLRRRREGGRPG